LNQKTNIVIMLREIQHEELLKKAAEFRQSEREAAKPVPEKKVEEKATLK